MKRDDDEIAALVDTLAGANIDRQIAILHDLGALGQYAAPISAIGDFLQQEAEQITKQGMPQSLNSPVDLTLFLAVLREPNDYRYCQEIKGIARGCLINLGNVALLTLLDALADPDPHFCAEVLYVLGGMGMLCPLTVFTSRLSDPHPEVRLAAIYTLIAREGDEVLPWLQAACEHDDLTVRRLAKTALLNRHEFTEEQLLDGRLTALSDPSWRVRQTAIETLAAEEKGAEALPLSLLFSAVRDESAQVRKAAIQALGHRSEPEVLPVLLDALRDPFPGVHAVALWGLCSFASSAPVEPIAALLFDEGEYYVNWAAMEALLFMLDRAPLPQLLCRIKHSDWEHRFDCRNALASLAPFLAAHPEAIGASSGEVPVAAMHVLAGMGELAPVDVLFAGLDHWYPPVRCLAIDMIGWRCDPLPVERLLPYLQDVSTSVRIATATILGKLQDETVFAAVSALLYDADEQVHRAVLKILEGRLSLEILLSLCSHPNWGGEAYWELITMITRQPHIPAETVATALYERFKRQERDVTSTATTAIQEFLDEYSRIIPWTTKDALHRFLGEGSEPNELLGNISEGSDEDRDESAAALTVEEILDNLNRAEPTCYTMATDVVRQQRDTFPLEPLIARFSDVEPWYGPGMIRALGALGERAPLKVLIDAVPISKHSTGECFTRDVIAALRESHPESMPALEGEAIAILRGQGTGDILGALEQCYYAEVIGEIADVTREWVEDSEALHQQRSPALQHLSDLLHTSDSPFLRKLHDLLHHSNWRVQYAAVRTLGFIGYPIPDESIQHLSLLSLSAEVAVVGEAASHVLTQDGLHRDL